MRRILYWFLLFVWLLSGLLPWAAPAQADFARQREATPARNQVEPLEPTSTPTPAPAPPLDLDELLARMTTADKVGQLFLITFQGRDVSPDSDVAVLVRDYRVGGVVLLPENDNYRNVPVPFSGPARAERPGPGEASEQPAMLDTPSQIVELTNALQQLALSPPRPVIPAAVITGTESVTVLVTPTEALTQTLPLIAELDLITTLTPTVTPTPTPTPTPEPTPEMVQPGVGIPLWIALDWPGDDSSFFAGTGGFTPLPSAMAMGATWSSALAEQVGQVVGQELAAVGVNLLLGPTLDVLDVPRPGNKGDLSARTFGGDPFWVGQMGQAFIRGVQVGSGGRVMLAAKHFPGQGGSDRRPEEEVPTVQRPLQQLRQIELAPFVAVTSGPDLGAPGITPALMTSHIRYRGLQTSIREVTPPISLAPQLQDLVALKEFADWRAAGGLLISEALGVPALRRYYDPTLTRFPHRQVAQDAFLAGNDILYLGRFALTDKWPDQVKAIKETVLFFQEKYESDSSFRARVDDAVRRILRQKLNVYGARWQPEMLRREPAAAEAIVGKGKTVTEAVARAALTLIYPSREELAERLPTAPLAGEPIVIFSDARTLRECAACEPMALIPPKALEEIILHLYGPAATGQIAPEQIRSFSFADLYQALTGPGGENGPVMRAIDKARWLVFVQLDPNPDDYPESVALRMFLARRSESLRDKRLVVLAASAPYYLDTTEISKLTAYFGIYSRTKPFLEAAVRVLFREFTPVGAPPVSVAGINYELIRQLEPAPGQIIALNPVGAGEVITRSIQVGSQLELETGLIVDRNGHPVPDGTLVEFHLRYPAESLALAPKIETTVGGRARTVIRLDRAGELWITVHAGEARDSTRIELKIGGDTPGSIATVVPTPTPEPTLTPTATPLPSATPVPTSSPGPVPMATPEAQGNRQKPTRVNLVSFLFGLLGTSLAGGAAFAMRRRRLDATKTARANILSALVAALWASITAWSAYVLYALGWLPGATALQAGGHVWVAGAVTLLGGLLVLPWLERRQV
ncbi:MAG: glycoside hydrolase family 3 N-terminal domain-containing protein [Anaerolineae bacterium]